MAHLEHAVSKLHDENEGILRLAVIVVGVAAVVVGGVVLVHVVSKLHYENEEIRRLTLRLMVLLLLLLLLWFWSTSSASPMPKIVQVVRTGGKGVRNEKAAWERPGISSTKVAYWSFP